MKSIYLFRHGETYFSKNEVPYGENELTAHILPESHTSIEKIGEYLKIQSIELALRSEFLRCQETAEIIEKSTSMHFEANSLLNEFTETEFDEFKQRMEKLTEFLMASEKQHIALCTHGAVIAALKRLLLKKEFVAHHLMYYPKTGEVLKIKGEKIEEINFN